MEVSNYQTPTYLKDLMNLKHRAEVQKESGKLEDKLVHVKVSKALYAVEITRIKCRRRKTKAIKVNKHVKRKLKKYIEDLITENARNRLRFITTKSQGHERNYRAIVNVINRLIEIYKKIPKEDEEIEYEDKDE